MNRPNSEKSPQLDSLFYPRSVAHVGASEKAAAGRFNFCSYLQIMNYEGRIYPVNPKYERVCDLACYPGLEAVPGEVDLAILAVPAARCPDVLRHVPAGKIRFVVIHTSGFGEIDKGDLEADLLGLAREKGFRIVGPNCMGVYCQEARVGFWQDQWEIVNRPGSVGFISQSGGHAINVIQSGMDSGIHFNKVISLGNQIDVSINDILAYMGRDEGIRVIGVYVENVGDGRTFVDLLREIVLRKPVVVWKGGVSSAGKEAAVTHTGSLAGNEKVFASALRQTGAIGVDNVYQMTRMLRVLQPPFALPGGRLAVFSPGGGNTVNFCDQFSARPNLSLPRLSPETVRLLKEILPEENVDVRNPVDPGATGMLKFDKLVKVVGREPGIDTLVLVVSVDFLSNIQSVENRQLVAETISETIARLSKKTGKPIYVLLRQERENHEDFDRYRRLMIARFNEKKVPWVDGSFAGAAEIFSKLAGYRSHLDLARSRAGQGGPEEAQGVAVRGNGPVPGSDPG